MNQIKEELECIRLMIDFPGTYLANYFENLRNRLNTELKSKNNTNKICSKLTKIINSCENRFQSNIKHCKINETSNLELKNFIELCETQLNSLSVSDEAKIFKQIKSVVLNEKAKLDQLIFHNTTVTLIESSRDGWQDCFSNDIFVKLLYINDLHIIQNAFDAYDFNIFLDPLNELIKIKRVKNKIQSVDEYFIEFSMDFNEVKQLNMYCDSIVQIKENSLKCFKNLESLNLAYNKIELVHAYSFSGFQLKELVLSSNRIKSLDPNLFKDLESLEKLDLSKNPFESFDFNALKSLNLLKELKLNEIPINSINSYCFQNFPNLRRLYLDAINLIMLEENTFHGLSSLQELHLGNNFLIEIRYKSFYGIENLKILNLAMNCLKWLSLNAFSYLKCLRELNLANNSLEKLNFSIFDELSNLVILNLAKIGLKAIKPYSLCQLVNLKELYLEDNQIEFIDQDTFNGLTKLKTLFLNGNRIKEIKQNDFIELKCLRKLDLKSNRISSIDVDSLVQFQTLLYVDISFNYILYNDDNRDILFKKIEEKQFKFEVIAKCD